MSRLVVRGFKHDVNMSSEGQGVYNMGEYLMGSPELDTDTQRLVCHDTITLNVVGKSREETSRYVSRLFRAFTAAVDYYESRLDTACYLEALITGDERPVWASVIAFEFHRLNDPYDYVNGSIIQNASLIVTREPWRDAPPQDSPYEIVDSGQRDITSRFVAPMFFAMPKSSFSTGTEATDETHYLPAIDQAEEFGYLTNFYRYFNIIEARHPTNGENMQRTTLDGVLNSYQIGYHEETGDSWFAVGARARFHGFVIPAVALDPQPSLTEIHIRYWKTVGDVPVPVPLTDNQVTIYFAGDNGRYGYIGITTAMDDWNPSQPFNLPLYYWVDVSFKTTGTTAAVIVPTDKVLHAPFQPFVDVLATPAGDMPASMHMKITGLAPWNVLDSQFGTSYTESPFHMNGLIMASAPIYKTESRATDPGVGFYSLAYNSPYVIRDSLEPMGWWANFGVAPHGRVPTVAADPRVYNYDRPFVKAVIPTRPGLYRAFVRYLVSNAPHGRVTLYLDSARSVIDGIHEDYDVSRSYSIDLGNLNVRNNVCLADFGVLQIGNRAFRNSFGERLYAAGMQQENIYSSITMRVRYEFLTGAAGDIAIIDMILLPMNEYFTNVAMSRGPLSRGGSMSDQSRIDNGLEMAWDLAAEYLYVSSLYPSEAVATVATDFKVGPIETIGDGMDTGPGYVRRRNIGEEANLINARQFVMPVENYRRYWFLWYKEAGDGTVWSFPDFQTAVKLYAVPRYLTLPAKR